MKDFDTKTLIETLIAMLVLFLLGLILKFRVVRGILLGVVTWGLALYSIWWSIQPLGDPNKSTGKRIWTWAWHTFISFCYIYGLIIATGYFFKG